MRFFVRDRFAVLLAGGGAAIRKLARTAYLMAYCDDAGNCFRRYRQGMKYLAAKIWRRGIDAGLGA